MIKRTYEKVCPMRTLLRPTVVLLLALMLSPPARARAIDIGVEEIVFAERVCGFDHWYANFGFYSAGVPEYPPQRGVPGGSKP